MKNLFIGLTLFVTALMMPKLLNAAIIEVQGEYIGINGPIELGDAKNFYDAVMHMYSLGINPTVVIQSEGGSVTDGLLLAQMVSDRELMVGVSSYCYSSCTFILMSSPYPVVLWRQDLGWPMPEIGVHSPYHIDGTDVVQSTQESSEWWSLYGLMRGRGLSDDGSRLFLDMTYSTPSEEIYILDAPELEKFEINFIVEESVK